MSSSQTSDPVKEHQLILRLPKDCADKVRRAMQNDVLGERLQVEFLKDPLGTMRNCKVKFDDDIIPSKLVDLPTIVESHKTLDNKVCYKTGDIAQMILCTEDSLEDSGEEKLNVEEMTAAKKKEIYKKYVYNHGVTPPLKNVRKRRFRKTKIKKMIESPEVEKELKRLLRADASAVKVSFKVVNEEDKHNDDSQSITSDSISQGHMLQDEDSLLSTSASYSHLSDDKAELLRMLEEASCSSSSSSAGESEEEEAEEEDDDEEEISVVDPSPENEEVTALRLAIQDLENQIEEQRLKIENTPMPLLRARFETFLGELEKQRKGKIEELNQLLS